MKTDHTNRFLVLDGKQCNSIVVLTSNVRLANAANSLLQTIGNLKVLHVCEWHELEAVGTHRQQDIEPCRERYMYVHVDIITAQLTF